jgi:hypothetical protein
LSAVTLAVGQSWMDDDGAEQLQVKGWQIANRVHHYLAEAKYIGLVNAGSLNGSASTPGSVCYWAADNWGGSADGKPQAGEMAVISHDPTTGTLWLYQPIPVSSMNAADLTSAAAVVSYSQMCSAMWVSSFESQSFVSSAALGTAVSGATFSAEWLASTTQRPVVESTLVFSNGPQQSATRYDTITLRSPTTQPN